MTTCSTSVKKQAPKIASGRQWLGLTLFRRLQIRRIACVSLLTFQPRVLDSSPLREWPTLKAYPTSDRRAEEFTI
jgi:hypothetical protein